MSKPRPTGFIPWPADEPPLVITGAWRDPSYRPPGRPTGPSPKSLAKAERAAASVMAQKAKQPNTKETPLSDYAAAEFHVSPRLVRAALKALKNKEKSRL